jgi:hypothetical protein
MQLPLLSVHEICSTYYLSNRAQDVCGKTGGMKRSKEKMANRK